jgi:transcriptional regulator with XRE-family HTH domain
VDAAAAQRGGGLGAVLRRYRHAGALTQQQLADMLGYDRTYISMIESGRRNVTDRGTLAHIARALAIPPYMLGIAGPDDADFAAMLAFGTSVIRLAATARKAGRAAEAVSELWPLVNRLEARAAAGYAEPETMRLLCLARMSLGVALGHVLPDERLATAARWTGRALRIAWQLGDRPLLGMVLRMQATSCARPGIPPPEPPGSVRLFRSMTTPPGREPACSCSPVRQPSPGRPTCSTPPPAGAPGRWRQHHSRTCCSIRSPSGRCACAGCWRCGAPPRRSTWPPVIRPTAARRLLIGGSSSGSPLRRCLPGPETRRQPEPCWLPPSATPKPCACPIRSSGSSASPNSPEPLLGG